MIQQRRQLAIIFTLVLIAKACPSSSDLDHMAKASGELAHDTLTANRVVTEIYKARSSALQAELDKASTAEQVAAVKVKQQALLTLKDKIAEKLGVIGDKGEKFNSILIDLDKKYPQGTLPPQDLQFVRDNLSELRALYTDVLADLLPFKAQKAVADLDKHLSTIEGVVK